MPLHLLNFSRLARLASLVFLVSQLATAPARADSPPASAKPKADEKGFTLLSGEGAEKQWNAYGKEGWPKGWKLSDGVLHRADGGGDVRTIDQYGDFDLRFEWKVTPGANSGVLYRVSDLTKVAHETGPEYQILDDAKHVRGTNPQTAAASMYGIYAPSKHVAKPTGEWNRGRIVVRGNHVRHFLNGEKVIDVELGSDDWKQRVADSKFAKWPGYGKSPRGHIVLQDHGAKVWYRNVRIKELAAKQGEKPAVTK